MASIISYESMEEQPAKRAKLDGFTTSTSIFSTQGAIGSTILSDAQYPEMYAQYDNPVVNTSIMPLVQNIMLNFEDTGNVGVHNNNAYNGGTKTMEHCEPGNFIRAELQTDGTFQCKTDSDQNTSLIIFADRPVMIKPGVYQIARAVAGVVTVHDDFFPAAATKETGAYGKCSDTRAIAAEVAAPSGPNGSVAGPINAAAFTGKEASYVYHYNEGTCGVSGFHKIYLELNAAF